MIFPKRRNKMDRLYIKVEKRLSLYIKTEYLRVKIALSPLYEEQVFGVSKISFPYGKL